MLFVYFVEGTQRRRETKDEYVTKEKATERGGGGCPPAPRNDIQMTKMTFLSRCLVLPNTCDRRLHHVQCKRVVFFTVLEALFSHGDVQGG